MVWLFVDVDADKIDGINQGRIPICEPGPCPGPGQPRIRASVIFGSRGFLRHDPRRPRRSGDLRPMQVADWGGRANSMVPGRMVKGIGGTIDRSPGASVYGLRGERTETTRSCLNAPRR